MSSNNNDIEKRLWDAADELRANSKLKSSEYSVPVLGLISLRYADHKFTLAEKQLEGKVSGRRSVSKTDYQAMGVMYLPPQARFSALLQLPEGADIARAISDAMKAIEAENEDLKGVLPKSYNRLDNATLFTLLRNFAAIPMNIEGDAFGKIYEYFLGSPTTSASGPGAVNPSATPPCIPLASSLDCQGAGTPNLVITMTKGGPSLQPTWPPCRPAC